jgi:hypothetical protein
MDQGSHQTHLSVAQGDPLDRETSRGIIYQAMKQIRAERMVGEIPAYAILVQESADARSTVRETAERMINGTG